MSVNAIVKRGIIYLALPDLIHWFDTAIEVYEKKNTSRATDMAEALKAMKSDISNSMMSGPIR